MRSTPWSLRDNPASLAIATIGLVVVTFVLGCITVRMGQRWTQSYIHQHARIPE